jgi:hypothetical protein
VAALTRRRRRAPLVARAARDDARMHTGVTGACRWVLLEGHVDEAAHQQVVAAVRAWGASTTPSVLLVVTYRTGAPHAQHRNELAQAVRELAHPEHTRAFALATTSPVARGALAAISWLVKSTMPYRAFRNPDAALAWLATQCDGVEPAAVHAALAAADDRYPAMRWSV